MKKPEKLKKAKKAKKDKTRHRIKSHLKMDKS